jgi:hypothetical protein
MAEPLPLELTLDYQTHWQKDRRRWRLPSAIGATASSARIWVDGQEIAAGNVRLASGAIELLDPAVQIGPKSKVIVEVKLHRSAQLSQFTQALVLAIVAIVPGTLAAVLTYMATTSGGSASAAQASVSIGTPTGTIDQGDVQLTVPLEHRHLEAPNELWVYVRDAETGENLRSLRVDAPYWSQESVRVHVADGAGRELVVGAVVRDPEGKLVASSQQMTFKSST